MEQEKNRDLTKETEEPFEIKKLNRRSPLSDDIKMNNFTKGWV